MSEESLMTNNAESRLAWRSETELQKQKQETKYRYIAGNNIIPNGADNRLTWCSGVMMDKL